MKNVNRFAMFLIAVLVFCLPPVGAEYDVRESLRPSDIVAVRVNLNPWGPGLGFETELPGDDSRLEALIAMIREAEPGPNHKCANAGAIRVRMQDGSVIGVGLLPGHVTGLYGFRLYDGDRYVAAYRVERAALLGALAGLGVPTDDPAFRE